MIDFTKDWSVAVSVRVQGQGVEGSNMSCCGTGEVSLTLKVQGPPVMGSNYGQYNTSAHDLYHVATRFNSNTWRAPTDDSRLLWVYTASTRRLQESQEATVGGQEWIWVVFSSFLELIWVVLLYFVEMGVGRFLHVFLI